MNDDRISEVYKGEIWTDDAQARARRRINWMISEVEGGRVLDLGCSQGIAAILLGREGLEVVGVDVQPSRIEYANQDLANEASDTQARVRFLVGNGSKLEFEDDSFDSVLLGEVIEHLAMPERVLREVHRVLKPGGRLILTTPFGVLHHHDHKQTFYPDDLFALLSRSFNVVDGLIADRYFRIVAVKGGEPNHEILDRLRDAAFETVRTIQQDLHEARLTLNRQSGELSKVQQALDQADRRAASLERRAADAERAKARLEESARTHQSRIAEARAQAEEAEQRRSDLETRYQSVSEELKRGNEQLKARTRDLNRKEREARHLAELQREVALLHHQVQVRDWKLKSMRQRKWWQLGVELGKVRRRPWLALSLPFAVARILRRTSQPLPRPENPRPSEPADPEHVASAEPTAPQLASVEPIAPRLDVPILASLSGDVAVGLRGELEVFDLDPVDWSRQLAELYPAFLVLDAAIADRWRGLLVEHDLLGEARSKGVTTVLWDSESSPLSGEERASFDAIVGDGKPPIDDYAGRLVKREGFVAPAVHNPVEARRSEDVADVDLVKRSIAGVDYTDTRQLCDLARNYKVLRVVGPVIDEELVPLVATGTPLIVTEAATPYGLQVDDDGGSRRLVSALLRSEVLRARVAHPAMREVMRQHSFGRDVLNVLHQDEASHRLPRIDVMVATKRPHLVDDLVETIARQSYPNVGLVLVTHGIAIDEARIKDLAAARGVSLQAIVAADESVVLGEVFNYGFEATSADFVAKMDDDDFYGSEYLWDLYESLLFSGAEVAGKWAHFVYLEGVDSLIYRFKRFEHRFTDVVAISTLLMHRRVLDAERFPAMPYGSGSVFLRALGAQGARVYAADRWNYMYIRGENGGRNTFPVTDVKLLSNSDVVCKGKNIDHVVL